MGLLADLKRGLRQAVMPVLLGALLAYFAWHAIHGSRGGNGPTIAQRS